ncbi:MATE family efflux transporter [Streptococcus cameli]
MYEINKILKIAWPAMVENFLQFLMGMVDTYLVAFLGVVALSGVSVANNILAVFQAVFIALASATSAILARSIGKQQTEKLPHQAGQSVLLSVFSSVVLGLFSIVFGQELLFWLGAEAAVAKAGGLYLMLVGGGIIFLGIMTSLGAVLRATGKNQLPMYVSLLSNVLNVLFSALGVFVFQAGIVGVALGTILARVIACIVLWKQLPFPLEYTGWRIEKNLLALALPTAGERLMMRAGDVVVVGLIVSLGTATVAGNAIGETVTQLNYMPALGFATATVILVAQASGQANQKLVKRMVSYNLVLSVLSLLLLAGLVLFFGDTLTHLYSRDAQVLSASLLVMLFSLVGAPATAGTLIYTATWQGLGNAKLPFYATSIGMWGIRVGLGFVLTRLLGWGLMGVWLATVLDNVFRASFLALLFHRYLSKKTR